MNEGEVVLALNGVTKRFSSGSGTVSALEDVTASVRRGERVALLGANGAGKTTCMDLVCGVTAPSAGHVTALGLAPRDAVRRGRMTAVLQTGGLLRDITVLETVQVIAGLHRRLDRVATVLMEAGLTAVQKRLVGRCSGGEQQRLKYALALIPDPEVLVLDEPAAGLDMAGRASLWDHVGQLAQQGTTIIFSTHHLEEVEQMAERVLLLQDGRVVADRNVGELMGPAAPLRISARLPNQAALAQVVGVLGGLRGVLDDGSDEKCIQLLAAPEVSDQVAARLLGEFGATQLVVMPQSPRGRIAELIAGKD